MAPAGAAFAAEVEFRRRGRPIPINGRNVTRNIRTEVEFSQYVAISIAVGRNVGGDSREVKGQLQATIRPSFSFGVFFFFFSPEIRSGTVCGGHWVGSRGSRGTRTDFITIYDTAAMNPIGEICCREQARAAPHGGVIGSPKISGWRCIDSTPRSSVTGSRLCETARARRRWKYRVLASIPSGTSGFQPLFERYEVDRCGLAQRRGGGSQRVKRLQSSRLPITVHRAARVGRRALLPELEWPSAAHRSARLTEVQDTADIGGCWAAATMQVIGAQAAGNSCQ